MKKNMQKEEFLSFMEEYAPKALACDWDNVGMLIDMGAVEYRKVMVALDLRQAVVEEALEQKVDLILTHHPVLFEPAKRLSVFNTEQQWLMMLIRNNISLFAAHTNLDSSEKGINRALADRLGLEEQISLDPREESFKKLVVFVPESHFEKARKAITDAGAGHIGAYSACTFSAKGEGSFLPLEGTKPYIGSTGEFEKVEEHRLETIVPLSKLSAVLKVMLEAHPYEEVAYDLYDLKRKNDSVGLVRMGKLKEKMKGEAFAAYVKEKLGLPYVRIAGETSRSIQHVAVSSGAGFGSVESAKMAGAEAFVSAELKHHMALTAREEGVLLVDAGHYETEHIIVPHLIDGLQERFDRLQYKTEFISCQSEDALIRTL